MRHTASLTLLAASMLFGCNHMKIHSERDPAYLFSGIRTYQWTAPPEEFMEAEGTFQDIEVQKALNNELAALGWKQVLDAADAGVQVAYFIQLRSHAEFSETTPGVEREFSGGLVFNRHDREWSYEQMEPGRIEYMVETGTFHVLLNDAATGNRIWHGTLETEIDRTLTVDEQDVIIRQIARKLIDELNSEKR